MSVIDFPLEDTRFHVFDHVEPESVVRARREQYAAEFAAVKAATHILEERLRLDVLDMYLQDANRDLLEADSLRNNDLGRVALPPFEQLLQDNFIAPAAFIVREANRELATPTTRIVMNDESGRYEIRGAQGNGQEPDYPGPDMVNPEHYQPVDAQN